MQVSVKTTVVVVNAVIAEISSPSIKPIIHWTDSGLSVQCTLNSTQLEKRSKEDA